MIYFYFRNQFNNIPITEPFTRAYGLCINEATSTKRGNRDRGMNAQVLQRISNGYRRAIRRYTGGKFALIHFRWNSVQVWVNANVANPEDMVVVKLPQSMICIKKVLSLY